MSIIEIGNALIVDYSDITTSNNSIINNIVNNTVNTWQQDRGYLEKQRDTQLGKLAEDAVICVFNNLKISNYHSYDDFRSDEFKDHAPFDGIFIENLDNEIIEFINNAVKNEGSRLSSDTREQLRKYNAYTVEVKSTRLAQKYKDRANFHDYNNANEVKNLVDSLMNLDYLTYPHYTRYGDMTYYEYCNYVENTLHTGLMGKELYDYVKSLELSHATDIYIRVFMDEANKKAIVMGWIDRLRFFNPPQTHKLILPGKSEIPLYFVKSLKYGYHIKELKNILK